MQERLPIRMTVRSCHEKETIWPSEYLLLLVLEGSAGLTGDRSDPLKRGTIVFLAPLFRLPYFGGDRYKSALRLH